ncbi:hypothetical protein EVAR_90907_1 [Eumeta japonica]|uniref:Reverse transcriptase domain-containing protein n=1 Tax=Eumeta variegata TaxID=151549 RepID=A0A4C2A4T4_EUMVA|nr:hypothetical protein EVAR_90907_1 [Eumeta japonica]
MRGGRRWRPSCAPWLPGEPPWPGRGYLRDREAFADDVVLMFSGQSASSIEEEANHALALVHCWGVRNKLRFAPSKQTRWC